MYGYSIRVAEAIKAADSNLLGVQLGLACLKHNISVSEVARRLGVTRPAVYNWFYGAGTPHQAHAEQIEQWLDELKDQA